MFKRKLFKRALPLILSVALVFESMPATAMAAESTQPETETVVEQTTPETVDEQDDTSESKPAESVEADETNSNETESSETTTSEVDTSSETTTSEAATSSETTATEGAKSSDTEVTETEVTETEESAALPKASINVNEDGLVSELNGLTYDYTTQTIEQRYTPYGTEIADNALSAVKNSIFVTIDNVDWEIRDNIRWNYVTYQWQQKAQDGTFNNINTAPQDAGEYKLIISLDDVEGVCTAADDISVNLEITKSVITVDNDSIATTFNPGITVAEVKEQNANFELISSDTFDDDGNPIGISKDAYLDAASTSIEVRKVSGGEALADTDILQKNEDYIFNINVTLKNEFANNYEVKSESYSISLEDAVETQVKITYKTEGKVIGKTYDGQPIDTATEVESNYEAKVVCDKDGVETDVPDAVLQTSWCDADKMEYEDEEFVPSDAGTYYYKLSYTDETGTYAASEEYVKVIIDMADIVIVPKLENTAYAESTLVSAIIKTAEYDVYGFTNGVKNEQPETIDEYYWGAAYNIDSDTTQYYEPVFEVWQGIVNGDTTTWTALSDSGRLIKDDNFVYKLVFSGKKAIYAADGTKRNEIDINTSQQNYQVDLSEAAVNGNAVSITVTESITVDVSAILQDGAGADYENAIVSTYDGESIYSTKADYKKAVAKAGENELARDTDSSLVYTWEKAYNYRKDESGNWSVGWQSVSYPNTDYRSAPYEAGEYRLTVQYKDTKSGAVSQAAYVYYTILPQNAKWVLTGTPKVYADDLTINDFLWNIQNYDDKAVDTYVFLAAYAVTDQSGTKADGNPFFIGEYYGYDNTDYFYIERQVEEGEDAGQWIQVDSGDTFTFGKTYRLNLDNDAYCSYCEDNGEYLGNYNFGKELDKHGQPVDGAEALYENEPVSVEVMDTQGIELAISVDESQITGNVKTYDANPFDLTALKSLVTVINTKDNSPVTDAELKYEFVVGPEFDGYGNFVYADEYWSEENAIHGGTYRLHIFVETNETYRYSETVLNTEFVINKAKLTMTPVLQDEIKADIYVDGNGYASQAIVKSVTVTGYVGQDADLLDFINTYVYKSDSKNVYTDNFLKSSETYYAACTGTLKEYNDMRGLTYADRDYELESERAAFTPLRAEAGVEAIKYDSELKTELKDTVTGSSADGYIHTVTTTEGIPYSKAFPVTVNGETESLEGNFFVFDITAPKEFANSGKDFTNNTFVYESIIRNAGGYVLNKGTCQKTYYESGYIYYYNIPYITVAFKADPEKLNEKIEFEIFWDSEYTEKFVVDFSSSILEDDFTKAVAPKSLSFNGANTKMAVGDTQQLDVKITKAQMSDIILLGYSVDNDKVLKVTDTGYVTALAQGSAAVKVYPCYLDKDGVKTPIANAKAATVKISVSNVAAPKLSAVASKDTYAAIKYTKPANGYRREIYVLEGKQKAGTFETAIAAVKNGDYSAFVYTNLNEKEVTDSKGIVTRYVENLLPASDYTVYVRNVSGLRALDDGSRVASAYAGAVKTFKTTKAMNTGLTAYFDSDLKGQTAFWNFDNDQYYAKVADKSAQLSVEVRFSSKYSDTNSDESDYIWRTLPLSSQDKKFYADPKLTYYACTGNSVSYYVDGWYYIGGEYYEPSNLAAVDKKGKVTFKGKGYVAIYVVDSDTGNYNYVPLYMDASPDSVKGKSVKMAVGQTIRLNNYLEYKEGRDKLAEYENTDATLSIDQVSNEYFKIDPFLNSDGTAYAYFITAIKPGGKLDITVTDKTVERNGGSPTIVRITSSVVEPVKKLKKSYVADKIFTVTYSYSQPEYEFRFDLKDERGKTIRTVTDTAYGTWNAKTKSYDYEVSFDYPEITLLSTYNLTVTALYEGQPSKEAKLKIKTTNIPASYENLGKGYDGGTNIVVATKSNSGSLNLADYPILKSGNTYTLNVPLNGYNDNPAARYRKTDTLTWKSSNPKVATVKANAGSYTATLKALSKGETTIEITSKVTKKVIARRTVTINAVGEANGYFGDNEPYRDDFGGIDAVVVDEKDVLELTMNNPITYTLNKGEGQWFVFTAPSYGNYTISSSYNMSIYGPVDGEYKLQSKGTSYSENLLKGTKRYIYIENKNSKNGVSGSVQVTGMVYTELILGENKVMANSRMVFFAPADNYYTFTYDDNGTTKVLDTASMAEGDSKLLTMPGDSGKDYVVTVSCREAAAISVGTEGTDVSINSADEEKWFSFTADEWGIYHFYTTDASDTVNCARYDSLNGDQITTYEVSAPNAEIPETELAKGETIYIKLTAPNASADKPVTAKLKVEKAPFIGNDGKVTVAADGTTSKTVTYLIPSQGDYRFTFSAASADAVITAKIWDDTVSGNVYESTFGKNESVKITVSANMATDITVAVEKTSVHVLSLGENTIQVAANAAEKTAFYATQNGLYTFRFEPVDGAVTVYDDFYNGNSVTDTKTIYLVPGDFVPYRITSTEDKEVKVTVTKETINELAAGQATEAALKAGETKYYKFTADMSAFYELDIPTVAGVTATVSWGLWFDDGEPPFTYGNQALDAGSSIYVRLTATTDAMASVKVGAVQPTALTVGEEKTITVPANSFVWAAFTPKKTTRYTFQKADADNFAIGRQWSLDTSGDAETFSFSDTQGEVINAAQTMYFKITNNNAEEKAIKLTINEVTAAAAGTSVELKNGEGKWFVFTADDTARYKFSASAVKEGKAPTASIEEMQYSLDSYSDEMTWPDDYGNLILKAGETRYLYVQASCDEGDTATVTLQAAKAGSDGALTADAGIAFEASETKSLTWTAPKDGWFAFSAKVGEADATGLADIAYYKNLYEGYEFIESGSVIPLTQGDVLTFEVTSDIQQTVKFAMNEETVTPITSEPTEIKVQNGDVKYFSFEEKETARYFIELTALSEGLTIADLGDIAGYHENFGGSIADGYYTFVGTMNQTYVFAIQAAFEGEGEKSFKIHGDTVAPAVMTTQMPVTIKAADVVPNHYSWYKFTAPEDGRYAFKLANATARIINNSLTGYAYDESFPHECIMAKDAVVYFALYNDAKPDSDVVFSVTKVVATQMTESNPVTIDITKVEENEGVWVTFTAPETGYYTFEVDDGNVYASAYKKIDGNESDSSKRSGYLPLDNYMNAGDTVLYRVDYSNAPDKNITLSVKKAATSAVTPDTEMPLSLEAGAHLYLAYTPESNIEWSIQETDATSILFELMNGSNTVGSTRSSLTGAAAAGRTIYIRATNTTSDKIDTAVTLTELPITSLQTGENTISFTQSGYQWRAYTASITGVYQFSGDSSFYYYGENPNGSGTYISSSSEQTVIMGQNSTVYIRINGTADDTVTMTVTQTQQINSVELTVGSQVPTSVAEDEDRWFVFTAPSDGTYRFYSVKTNGDPYVTVYRNGIYYDYDDDSAGYLNFSISITLSQGETIYLDTHGFSHNAADYTVYAEKES